MAYAALPRAANRGPDVELDRDEAAVGEVRAALAAWYDCGHRPLPWREGRDPYRVLVSEVMLVQTTVAAVAPYYARFLALFPTAEALAAADEVDVLRAWEGLGYYRRARQLHAAARQIVERHGGAIPADPALIRALPGVGRYIAGAVASFAFDLPEPILEANTQRALARLLAWDRDVSAPASQRRLWEAAARLVPLDQPGRFNQALTELGATVCTPRDPTCLICPVARLCGARLQGRENLLPVKTIKPKTLEVVEACAVVQDPDGRRLMVRRGPGRLWEGFWEFPTVHLGGADPAGRSSVGEDVGLAEGVRRLADVDAEIGPAGHILRFGVTRHRVTLSAHRGRAGGCVPRPGPGLVEARWVDESEASTLPRGAATRRVAAWASGPGR